MRFATWIITILLCSYHSSALAQGCLYSAAHGSVFSVESGERVDATEETLANKLLTVMECIKSQLPNDDLNLTEFAPSILAVGENSSNKRLLLTLEAYAFGTDDELVREQLLVARRLAEGVNLNRKSIVEAIQNDTARMKLLPLARESATYSEYTDAYRNRCESEFLVPIPPPIASGNWSGPTSLTGDFMMLKESAAIQQAWIYKSDFGGMCVTFARASQEGDVPFMGTICMNADDTHACFFDNTIDENGKIRRLNYEDSLVASFEDRAHPLAEGQENCGGCHIGDNPFIVHPGTELAKMLNPNSEPTKKTQFHFVEFGIPESDFQTRDWCNPKPVDLGGKGTCTQCHNLPLIGNQSPVCSFIAGAANHTMPPRHPGSGLWPDEFGFGEKFPQELESFKPSLEQLFEMCNRPATGVCP